MSQSRESHACASFPNTACAADATASSNSRRIATAISRASGLGIGECNFSHRRLKAGSSGSASYSAVSYAISGLMETAHEQKLKVRPCNRLDGREEAVKRNCRPERDAQYATKSGYRAAGFIQQAAVRGRPVAAILTYAKPAYRSIGFHPVSVIQRIVKVWLDLTPPPLHTTPRSETRWPSLSGAHDSAPVSSR